ncbi:MAG: ferric reductase-like transmembrane domain-containing protein [Lentimicrobium sp.]|jgi:predicted ferric reductase|nr:ferric reductase-like transmembrane domain-containing protein [Lentimicrobium sp.]
MENKIKIYHRIAAGMVFIAFPLLFYVLGDFPRRTLLKETISVVTLIAFFMMLFQFYLSRANGNILKEHKMSKVVKWHKVLGYVFVSILLVHPFLIVLPRYFEAGVEPLEALTTILTTFGSKGIILGLSAWVLVFIIGLTSILRNKLGLSYKAWRISHGILSIVFISVASLHVVELGRHINQPMQWMIAVLSIGGITLLIQTYLFKKPNPKQQQS